MAVAPVRLQREVDRHPMRLQRKDEMPTWDQRVPHTRECRIEPAEINQRVGRHHDVQLHIAALEKGHQLGLDQLVVDAARVRQFQHFGRQIHARQVAGIGAQVRAAQPRTAAYIQYAVPAFRRTQKPGHGFAHPLGRPVIQQREFGIEAFGEMVELVLHIPVRGAVRHIGTAVSGQKMPCIGVVRLILQPLAQHLAAFFKAPAMAIGDGQQAPRVDILGLERQGVGEMRERLGHAILRSQQ